MADMGRQPQMARAILMQHQARQRLAWSLLAMRPALGQRSPRTADRRSCAAGCATDGESPGRSCRTFSHASWPTLIRPFLRASSPQCRASSSWTPSLWNAPRESDASALGGPRPAAERPGWALSRNLRFRVGLAKPRSSSVHEWAIHLHERNNRSNVRFALLGKPGTAQRC
jgi:hypothetical protein